MQKPPKENPKELFELESLGIDFEPSASDQIPIESVDGESATEEAPGDDVISGELGPNDVLAVGTELEHFESTDIEEAEVLEPGKILSIVESMLFATDKPLSIAALKGAFVGTKVRSADIRLALSDLQDVYSDPRRGVILQEVAAGYQLRTRPENKEFLLRTVKARPFKLSGPVLEVLSIVAYKQPCPKSQVDEVRGVESGHLMRGLLDRGLINFAGKSELPGRPMTYCTSKKFLEIFGLRNLQELPSLGEIDELIPDGIGELAEEKPKLSDITGALSTQVNAGAYSQGEEELIDISADLKAIDTTAEFFEEEKRRLKEKANLERATDIRERILVGETVEPKDVRWLAKYDAEQAARGGEVAVDAPQIS